MPQVAIANGTGQVYIPQNPNRLSLLLLNLDGTDNIFGDTTGRVGIATTTNTGIRLTAGSGLSVNRLTDGLAQIQDSWTFISSANTPTLAWFETEKINKKNGMIELTAEEILQQILNFLTLKWLRK